MWRGSDSRVAGCHLQCLCLCVCAFCHCWWRRRSEGKAAHCEQQTEALSPQAHNMYSFVGGVCIMGSRMRRWSRLDKINADVLHRKELLMTESGKSVESDWIARSGLDLWECQTWDVPQISTWLCPEDSWMHLEFRMGTKSLNLKALLRSPRGHVLVKKTWGGGWGRPALTEQASEEAPRPKTVRLTTPPALCTPLPPSGSRYNARLVDGSGMMRLDHLHFLTGKSPLTTTESWWGKPSSKRSL